MKKLYEAHGILKECIGWRGVWADPTRYRGQCWTRDFALAIQPLLLQTGQADAAARHLRSIAKLQKPDGQVPIVFLDGPRGTIRFLADKIGKSIRDRRVSFMLRRWAEGRLHQLTPGTRDSEVMYVMAACDHFVATHELPIPAESLDRAMEYVKRNLLDDDGLLCGCDWRDTMEKELGDVPLLSNNCVLHHAYDVMGMKSDAGALRTTIDRKFWKGNLLEDWPGSGRFDPLGASLAVLNDVIPPFRYENVLECLKTVDSPTGVTIRCRHNPMSAEEAEVIERTDGKVTWPFVVGFTILATHKIFSRTPSNPGESTRRDAGLREEALKFGQEQMTKLGALEGFREWYDPATGRGHGAQLQLWSATLYARAATLGWK